jgi:hypothetical protein
VAYTLDIDPAAREQINALPPKALAALRRFDAGVSAKAEATAPPPSTFGGALYTALAGRVDEIHGYVVSTDAGPVFPVPADGGLRSVSDRELRCCWAIVNSRCSDGGCSIARPHAPVEPTTVDVHRPARDLHV